MDMFKGRFRFKDLGSILETDVLIVPTDEWAARPESKSPAWLATVWRWGDACLVVAVRDATRNPLSITL